jgi:streptogramin lyase
MPKVHFNVIAVLAVLSAIVCAAQTTIIEYPIPSGNLSLWITPGPDGNLWFTEPNANQIGRITPAGVITEFPAGGEPTGITAGPDGNLWFTEESGSAIGKMTTAGVLLAEYPVSYFPCCIAAGPDGNLWFTEIYTSLIGRITPAGLITYFGPTSSSYPAGITAGSNGNLWFAEEGFRPDLGTGVGASIGQISTVGVIIREFPLVAGTVPYLIAAGPDGNLWFTEASGNKIGRITPAGAITEFPLPTSGSYPIGITGAPDGNVWFVEPGAGDKIGRITPAGVITEFITPTSGSVPYGIAAGQDGNLWFTEAVGKIGKVILKPVATNKDACKDGGWMNLYRADGSGFKNQGDCIQYVNTGK